MNSFNRVLSFNGTLLITLCVLCCARLCIWQWCLSCVLFAQCMPGIFFIFRSNFLELCTVFGPLDSMFNLAESLEDLQMFKCMELGSIKTTSSLYHRDMSKCIVLSSRKTTSSLYHRDMSKCIVLSSRKTTSSLYH